ncbi:hypothetical protein MIR68_007575 [Amoeboaphelidium protococcarum]|nr:hypothetical protein MIR68_007575 [Amoeboaphelidium protococcarum]
MEDALTQEIRKIEAKIVDAEIQQSALWQMMKQENQPEHVVTDCLRSYIEQQKIAAQLNAQKTDLMKYRHDIWIKSSQNKIKVVLFNRVQKCDITEITGINAEWQQLIIPAQLDDDIKPSEEFFAMLDKNFRVFVKNSETACRTVIDLFLTDIVSRPEFKGLRIFCEQPVATLNYEVNKSLQGYVDYVIGHNDANITDEFGTPPQDSHLVVHEAKKEFPQYAVLQCVAQAAAIYKNRKDANIVNPRVWGICSNATLWKFVHIDNDGQLHVSDLFVLNRQDSGFKRDDVLYIYRILHHIFLNAYLSSPTTTPHQSTHDLGELVEAEDMDDTFNHFPPQRR